MLHSLRFLCIFFILFSGNECISQNGYKPIHYGVDQGLNSELIYKTLNLPSGELIIATQRGLIQYDGHRFILHDSIHLATLSLAEKNGRIYAFDSDNLFSLNRFQDYPKNLVKTIKTDSNPNNDHFENIFIDKQNRIWGTDFENLKYFNSKTNQITSFPIYKENKSLNLNLNLIEISSNQFLLPAPNGLWLIDVSNTTFQLFPKSQLKNLAYQSGFQRQDGSIILATKTGENFEISKDLNEFKNFPSLPDNQIIWGIQESEKGLIIQSLHKIYFYKNRQYFEIYANENQNIHHVNYDNQTGIIWLSTSKGLVKLQPIHPAISILSYPESISPVISIANDNLGGIWTLSENGEIWLSKNENFQKFSIHSKEKLYTLHFSKGHLYLSGSQKIYKFVGGQFIPLPIKLDPDHNIIKSFWTPENEFWVVYTTRELERYSESFQKIEHKIGVPEDFWTANKWQDILVDQNDRIWLVGWMPKSFGITYFDNENQEFVDISDPKINSDKGIFVGDYFTKIGIGKNQNLLFTAYGGWNESDNDGKINKRVDFHSYTFADTHLRGIGTDAKGNVFFATGEGLHIYREELDKVFRLTKKDGLPTDFLLNSFFTDYNKDFLIGIEGGYLKINPNKVLKTQLKNRLTITNVLVNGKKKILDSNRIELAKNENDLLIQLSDLAYLSEGKLEFQYKFSDEKFWHSMKNPELNLNHLQPGFYTIQFRVLDNLGNVQSKMLNVEILAKPPFFKSIFFYFLLFISLILLIFFIQRYFLNKQKEKQVYLRKIKDAEMKTLRSQMNPHFLFNTLNSINSFIIQNKTDDASSYLTTFSKLMRNILENSKQEQISLKKELDSLKLYLELESVRLDHVFDYSFEIDKEIDQHEIMIPPLIIQPFAENAIWHGLRNLKESGLLQIKVAQPKEDCVQILIIDNGIGRIASSKMNKNNTQHKSYGIEITIDRIRMLNPKNNVKIIDLYTADSKPAGTKIILTLTL